MQNSNEIVGLGKSKRPRVCGCDLHKNLTSFRGAVQITSRFSFKEVFCTVLQSTPITASARAADLFRRHGGIIRMVDILRGGITRNTLYSMRDSGLVVQMARGLYRLAEMAPLSQSDLVTVAAKAPHAVIYLVSALSFHELTTQIPHEVWIAIPRNSHSLECWARSSTIKSRWCCEGPESSARM